MKNKIIRLFLALVILLIAFTKSQNSYAGDGGGGTPPIGDEYIRFEDVTNNSPSD